VSYEVYTRLANPALGSHELIDGQVERGGEGVGGKGKGKGKGVEEELPKKSIERLTQPSFCR